MKRLSIISAFIFLSSASFAQDWSLTGNTIAASEYLGTDGSSNQPLRLRTATSDAIIFQTNGANERMRVDAGGFVGIGTTTPNYLLQTHESTASTANYIQVGNNTSGGTSTDGLLVGLDATGRTVLNQQENRHINLFTNAVHRIKLNPSISYHVNGHSGTRNGYLLLGNSAGANASLFSSDTMGGLTVRC